MATERAGPSFVAAGAAQHADINSDFDSNVRCVFFRMQLLNF